jgi:prepilin-type N-terminal cleavage/methylation domain-containing protein
MTPLAAARRRLADRANGDDGFTMLELVVTMTIMTIVLVIFASGVIQAYAAEDRVDASANSETEISIAFQRLDKEIRYAAGISNVGTVSGDSYVEFLTSFTGTAVCTELRLHVATNQLQQRTWTQGMTPLVPTAWTPLASFVTATTPFTLTPANIAINFQRLEITLNATTGSGPNAITKQSNITFTALNTSLNTNSATTCTEGRAVS